MEGVSVPEGVAGLDGPGGPGGYSELSSPASPGWLSFRSNLRNMVPDHIFYVDVYGGTASAEAFAEALPAALRLMRAVCGDAEIADEGDLMVWRCACCAAVEAFAEFGEGRVGGYAVGDFKVTNYMEKGTTGREVALEAALAELAGTGLSFCGVV